MGRLICVICGGRLVMGRDGVFQCDVCGSCYSKEWAKSKVQETTGTVLIEDVAAEEGLLKRAQEVNLFQAYEAIVSDILSFECEVCLIKSGRIAHIHTSEISDPSPKRIADVLSIGDQVCVTIISNSKVGKSNERYLGASLLPPETQVGYYLQCPSIDAMKKLLIHLGIKFSPRMIVQAKGELNRTKGHPDISLSSSAIEDRIERCELLLAKALHDNPDCAIEIPLEASPTGMNMHTAAWKTKEMQTEAKRIWEMGQAAAKILNDSSWTFLFLRRLLDFLSKPYYFAHDCDKNRSSHTDYFDDEGSLVATLDYGKFAFAHGNIYFNNTWGHFPFSLPDIETLKCWYINYKKGKCFAGGSLNFWSSKSSICRCTSKKCHIDNPQCPLHDTPH